MQATAKQANSRVIGTNADGVEVLICTGPLDLCEELAERRAPLLGSHQAKHVYYALRVESLNREDGTWTTNAEFEA